MEVDESEEHQEAYDDGYEGETNLGATEVVFGENDRVRLEKAVQADVDH